LVDTSYWRVVGLKRLGEQAGPICPMRRLLFLSAALFISLGLTDNPGWTQNMKRDDVL
jgi:hypothetical protein